MQLKKRALVLPSNFILIYPLSYLSWRRILAGRSRRTRSAVAGSQA
jgi:hypothetical protein